MATPPRLVELKCPVCQHHHWVIDHDYRGSELFGDRELSYDERTYDCPFCSASGTGYQVIQKSPPAFLLQPHDLYPMSVRKFAHWFSIFRTQFPTHEKLGTVGVSWYPGKEQRLHEERLSRASEIGKVQGYYLSLSNISPDDERIRVCVQRDGEAHFWIDPIVELDRSYFGFDDNDLNDIRELLSTREPEIRAAWTRFSTYAKEAQGEWLAKLAATELHLNGAQKVFRRMKFWRGPR